jgi:competence protein ComEC
MLPFLCGVLTEVVLSIHILIPLYVFLLLLALMSAFTFFLQKKLAFSLRWLTGMLITIFFILAGYQVAALRAPENNNDFFAKYTQEPTYAIITLTEPPQLKEKSCKMIAEVNHVRDSTGWKSTSGKAVIYFEKDSFSEKLKYGDKLLIKAFFTEVMPPANPMEFNYKQYLAHRGIFYQAYVKSNTHLLIAVDEGGSIPGFAYRLRDKLLKILSEEGISGSEYAVISAMLLGNTDNLDPETIKSYQGSGAMHILSISGLHVGVVFIVLNFLLQFLDKFRHGKIPKAILLLLCIWLYALITGMSPSVLRATAMFSFVIVGKAFRQPPNIYNTLAASALLLILFNPFIITAVGFQLSYLAVIGIVTIYPFIYKAWSPKYKIIDKVWSLIAVSLAAQLATFPLCLLYFHQFPNYFLLANIVAVPLSGLVIYLGLAALALSAVPVLSALISKALVFSLKLLNGSVDFIEKLPYSVSDAIYISFAGMILIYLLIIMLSFFLYKKSGKAFSGSLAVLFILLIFVSFRQAHSLEQKLIVVYNINKHTAVDFVDGQRCFFVGDSLLLNDAKKQAFHIYNERVHLKVDEVTPIMLNASYEDSKKNTFYKKAGFVYFAGKKLGFISKTVFNTKLITLDYLLLLQNVDMKIEDIMKQYKFKLLIMDASNSVRNIEKWIQECNNLGIPYYVTRRAGAWIENVNHSNK